MKIWHEPINPFCKNTVTDLNRKLAAMSSLLISGSWFRRHCSTLRMGMKTHIFCFCHFLVPYLVSLTHEKKTTLPLKVTPEISLFSWVKLSTSSSCNVQVMFSYCSARSSDLLAAQIMFNQVKWFTSCSPGDEFSQPETRVSSFIDCIASNCIEICQYSFASVHKCKCR